MLNNNQFGGDNVMALLSPTTNSVQHGNLSLSRHRSVVLRAMLYPILLCLLTIVALMPSTCAFAGGDATTPDISQYTVDTIVDWLHKYENATPSFKPGDVLTNKDLERLRPFMVPGYLEQLNFPGARVEIATTRNHLPRQDFLDCTEKYQNQVVLKK